ncbi:translation initiation factor IF-2-like, partial [Harpia harpyja]|uniref:translation initiation factor IF-2-like n=1 Tax=Harpia harpyja TaxID=202280 RepID=UPI0022B0DD6E
MPLIDSRTLRRVSLSSRLCATCKLPEGPLCPISQTRECEQVPRGTAQGVQICTLIGHRLSHGGLPGGRQRRGCPGASQAGSGAEAAAAAVAASPLAAGRGAGSRPSPRRPGQPRPLPAAPGAAGAAGDCLPLVAVRRRPAGTAETCGCGEKGVSAGCPRREPQPPGVSLPARRRWRAATQSCPGVLGSPRGKRPVRLQGGRQRHFQSSPVPLALLLPSPGWEKGGRPRKQVKRRKEVSGSAAVEEMVKRRRVEVGAEASCPQSGMGSSYLFDLFFELEPSVFAIRVKQSMDLKR